MAENLKMPNKYIILLLLLILEICFEVNFVRAQNYEILHENGLYITKINLNSSKIEPYVSDDLETIFDIAQKTKAFVAINTGFFDAKNKKTVSFITKNGKILANPQENENLSNNPEIIPYLDKIYNRGELRILNCNNRIKADITYHNDPVEKDCLILNSTQAGPILLPYMNLEKEFFILKQNGKIVRDGAGMTRRTDRSMVAIKGENLFFIITDEDNPLNIFELHDKLKDYRFDKALCFDGGGSVSLFVKNNEKIFYQDREEKDASRKIKSAIIVY